MLQALITILPHRLIMTFDNCYLSNTHHLFQIFSLPESLYQTEPELSHLETSFNALNTGLDQGEAGPGDSEEEEDSDCVNNSFDIEALVDECFMNETNVQ